MIFEKIRERLQKAESVKCYGSRNSGNYLIPLTDAINIINKIEVEYNNGWIPFPEPYVAVAKNTTTNKERIMQHFIKGE